MLPASKPQAPSLADVLKSCLGAVTNSPGRLALPSVERAIVVLVDGLGMEALSARAGHARTLLSAATNKSTIDAGFPTTTASAITTLTTGVLPGRHGLVGYAALDHERDRVVNQLTGWDEFQDPATWQRVPTLFETAVAQGLSAVAIGPDRYRGSGFSQAALRGARYLGGASISDRVGRAVQWLRGGAPGIAYLYVPELDVAAHAKGWQSGDWTNALELADAGVRSLIAALGPRDGLVVTADHGVLDVPAHSHVLVDEIPELLDGVRHIAGEPRCLQLHLDLGADAETIAARWRDSESDRSWVATRAEAVESGWFGDVDAEVLSRMGDLFIAARKAIVYYDGRTAGNARGMVGQHGSLSPAELRVPLLKFGAFAS